MENNTYTVSLNGDEIASIYWHFKRILKTAINEDGAMADIHRLTCLLMTLQPHVEDLKRRNQAQANEQ